MNHEGFDDFHGLMIFGYLEENLGDVVFTLRRRNRSGETLSRQRRSTQEQDHKDKDNDKEDKKQYKKR